jgi:hypothetical protein
VAALITHTLGPPVELVVGGRGEFSVWVGDTRVAQKTRHDFPSDEDIVGAVGRAIGG